MDEPLRAKALRLNKEVDEYRRHAVYARGMRHHILGWPFITKRRDMGESLDKISDLLDRAADSLEGGRDGRLAAD